MNLDFKRFQRLLRMAPLYVFVVMNIVLSIGLGLTHGMAATLFFIVTFFGTGLLAVSIFLLRVFPAFISKRAKYKRQLPFFMTLLAILMVCGTTAPFFNQYFGVNTDLELPPVTRSLFWLSLTIMGMLHAASMRLSDHYFHLKLTELRLLADKANAELNILKNQINPHFLFNILNNIYGLAYLGDKKAAKMISKLSDIMRYLLYECNQDKVKLAHEALLIKNYLNLQALKYDHKLNIDYYQEGIYDEAEIPPMILINFVENCFKHSDVETNPDAWIKVSIELHAKQLHFTTANSLKQVPEKILFERKGIGLSNTKKLLKAHYPNNHHLKIHEKVNTFEVELTINI